MKYETTTAVLEQEVKENNEEADIHNLQEVMVKESEKEVFDFQEAGKQALEADKKRATAEGLHIDEEDKQKLEDINREADEAEQNLLEKLGESEFTTDNQQNKDEVRDFSKRYSSFRRSEVASQIWKIRKEYQEKKKQTEQQNIENQERRVKISEELETRKREVEQIEKEISDFEKNIQEKKSKIWHKFINLFGQKELNEEIQMEAAQKRLSIAQQEILEKNELLTEVRDAILESSDMENAKSLLKDFYNEQSEIKTKLEEEREQRDLAKIAKERGVTIVHGLPLDSFEMNNTSENNTLINTKEVDAQSKIQMILGIEPTLSTSTINEKSKYNKGIMYPFGVILGGGEVVSAYQGDAGTETESLYARRSKYDKNLTKSVIQNNITKKIEDAIENPLAIGERSEDGALGMGFNEIIVENPKVSGLYVDLENKSSKLVDIDQINKISEQLNLSVFGLKEGKIFDLSHGGLEISFDKILDSTKDLSVQKRLKMAENSIESVFSKVPLEAKRKVEELRKKSTLHENTSDKSETSKESNLINARNIELRGKISDWAEKMFSEGTAHNANDLIRIAKEIFKGNGPGITEAEFGGKSVDECAEIIKKFKDNRNKLNYFFDRKKYNIRF